MKKKIYVAPLMEVVKINTESCLLESSVAFGSEYGGGGHRSRGGDDSWDDEE